MYKFEIEHWPSYFGKHVLKRLAIGYVKGFLLLGGIAIVAATIYFFAHLGLFYRIAQGCVLALMISPFLPLISYIQRNKKLPAYGINQDGFLLNERGWNAAFFKWEEIKNLKIFHHPKYGMELHFEFVSYSSARNKPGQDKYAQSLAREYEIEKQPKKISNQLVKGDTTDFIHAFEKYYKMHKSTFPISESEAFDLTTKYIEEFCLPMHVTRENCLLEKQAKFTDEPCYVFPVVDLEDCSILVSLQNKSVIGIRTLRKVDFPHLIENNLTKKMAIDKVKSKLDSSQANTEVLDAHFYYGGMGSYDFPCWIVYTQMDQLNIDYVLNASTTEIVDKLTS